MSLTRRHLVAAFALLAAASACGNNGASTDGKVTLTFWSHTHPPMVDLNKKLVAEYEKQNPNVKVQYETIPNDQFGTKMLTSLSNGSGPDIINMDDSALRGEYIPKKLLAPIDPAGFGAKSVDEIRAKYNEGTLDGASGDGQLYGVPSEFNATAFAINTKHFKDAGLDPTKPPQTWDDVAAYGKKLVAAGHEQAYSFNYLHSGWYTQQLQTLLNQTGGEIADPKTMKETITSPEAVEALRIWAKLATGPDKVHDPNASSRDATSPFADFSTGRQSMAVVYPWSMEQIRQSNPDTYEQLEVVPLPQVDTAKPVNRWYAYYWAVNVASKQQPEAWKFISFMADNHERWLSDVDFIQPTKGWETSAAAKELPALDVWADAYAHGAFDTVVPHYAEIQDAVTEMVNDAVFNGVAPEQAAKKAAEQIQRSLDS
jgi:ABC-type glycerol-3-phosphate transport system substrate-binding protein